MKQNIAGLRKAFENGKIHRRQLIQALGVTAGAAASLRAFHLR